MLTMPKGQTDSQGGTGSQEKCGVCAKAVLGKDHGLQCEICEIWFHAKCQNMTEDTYRVLNQESIHWFCKGWDKRVAEMVKKMAKMQLRQDRMEEDWTIVKQELEVVRNELI